LAWQRVFEVRSFPRTCPRRSRGPTLSPKPRPVVGVIWQWSIARQRTLTNGQGLFAVPFTGLTPLAPPLMAGTIANNANSFPYPPRRGGQGKGEEQPRCRSRQPAVNGGPKKTKGHEWPCPRTLAPTAPSGLLCSPAGTTYASRGQRPGPASLQQSSPSPNGGDKRRTRDRQSREPAPANSLRTPWFAARPTATRCIGRGSLQPLAIYE
jgi:hypothetical protein